MPQKHIDVLHTIFPAHVVELLSNQQPVPPELFKDVTILFADVEGFTSIGHECTAFQTFGLLHDLYVVLDNLLSRFPKLYKVETIGDCIVVMSGAPISAHNSLSDLVQFALLAQLVVPAVITHPITKAPVSLRIGMHTGDVVGGVMGSTMPRYTFSGDSMNTAARMQSLSHTGGILVSSPTAAAMARKFGSQSQVDFISQGSLYGIDRSDELDVSGVRLISCGLQDVKGKGQCQTFSLHVLEDELASGGARAATRLLLRSASEDSLPGLVGDLALQDPVLGPSSTTSAECMNEALSTPRVSSLLRGPNVLSVSSTPSTSSRNSSVDHLGSAAGAEVDEPDDLVELGANGAFIRRVVEMMRETAGSSFSLVLPSSCLDGVTVLIAEDSHQRSANMCRQFRLLNPSLTVQTCSSYSELRSALVSRSFAVDLVMMNTTFAESLDGARALRSLKSSYPQQMRRVITVLFANDCNESELAAFSASADAFMALPLPSSGEVLQSRIVQLALTKAYQLAKHEKHAKSRREVQLQSLSTSTEARGRSMIEYFNSDDFLHFSSSEDEEGTPLPLPPQLRKLGIRTADSTSIGLMAPDGLRFLVVEDSHAQRKLLIRRLQECNKSWTVAGVQDATECISYLRENNCGVDVLLVDQHLGDVMTGSELVKELRSKMDLSRQLIVGLNRDHNSIEGGFLANGADAAWSKPVPLAPIVKERLRRLLQARHKLDSLR